MQNQDHNAQWVLVGFSIVVQSAVLVLVLVLHHQCDGSFGLGLAKQRSVLVSVLQKDSCESFEIK